jgi:hypothetical protein
MILRILLNLPSSPLLRPSLVLTAMQKIVIVVEGMGNEALKETRYESEIPTYNQSHYLYILPLDNRYFRELLLFFPFN